MTPSEIKSLAFPEKTAYFRRLLTDGDIENEVDILNVFRVVNSYNVFDETFFSQEASYINDVTEFIDIKTELEEEINEFITELITWYLSIIASSDIPLTLAQDNTKRTIPATFYGIFILGSVPMLSSLMNKIDLGKIDMTNLYKVQDGFTLLSRLFGNQAIVGAFLEKL